METNLDKDHYFQDNHNNVMPLIRVILDNGNTQYTRFYRTSLYNMFYNNQLAANQ